MNMTRQIKYLAIAMIVMYSAVFLKLNQIQVVQASDLANDPRTRGNIANQIKTLPIRRLGFEANHLVYGRVAELREDLPAVELVPTSDLIEGQRAHKDAAELAILRRAVAISDQAFDEVSREIRPGIAEWSAERDFIANRLKTELFNQAFGVEKGDEIEARRDPVIQKALEVLGG